MLRVNWKDLLWPYPLDGLEQLLGRGMARGVEARSNSTSSPLNLSPTNLMPKCSSQSGAS